MKRAHRWLLAVLAVLLVAGAAAWLQREAILLDQVNGWLRPYGFQATRLGIGGFDTRRLQLRHLDLLQDDGTRYELRGLDLPLRMPGAEPLSVTLDSGRLIPPPGPAAPVPVARLLGLLLSLPDSLPNTTVTIGGFEIEGFLVAERIEWRDRPGGHSLRLELEQAAVEADIDTTEPGTDHVRLGLAPAGLPELTVEADLRLLGNAYAIEARAGLDLAAWVPSLGAAGPLPEGLSLRGGRLETGVGFTLPDDPVQPLDLQLSLSALEPLAATWQPAGTEATAVSLALPEAVQLQLNWPSLDWRLNAPRLELQATGGMAQQAKAEITGLSCTSPIACRFGLAVDARGLQAAGLAVGHARFEGSLEAILEDALTLSASGEPQLSLEQLRLDGWSLDRLRLSDIDSLRMAQSEAGLQAGAAAVQLEINGLSGLADATGEAGLQADLAVGLKDLRYGPEGAGLRFEAPARSVQLSWQGRAVPVPKLAGKAALAGEVLQAQLDAGAPDSALELHLSGRYDLAAGKAHAELAAAELRLEKRSLKAWAPFLPGKWDVLEGRINASGAFELSAGEWTGAAELRLAGLAGFYADIAFSGLATETTVRMGAGGALSVEPLDLRLALFEVGFPIERLAARLEPDLAAGSVRVAGLGMDLLGGRIDAEPFDFRWREDFNRVPLRVGSVQLAFIAGLADLDGLEVSGSLSGSLPIEIRPAGPSVAQARWSSDPPGGYIRYRGGMLQAGTGNMGVELVSRALSDFNYTSLSADVNYVPEGDLLMKMRLQGVNPSMDPLQPVILNLSLENNVLQMLRSLQAGRAIEDILDR